MALGIPQYRLRAIDCGHLREIRPDLARRYFHFLGIEAWVARWCRANRELARHVGLLDDAPQRRRAPGTREGRRGGYESHPLRQHNPLTINHLQVRLSRCTCFVPEEPPRGWVFHSHVRS